MTKLFSKYCCHELALGFKICHIISDVFARIDQGWFRRTDACLRWKESGVAKGQKGLEYFQVCLCLFVINLSWMTRQRLIGMTTIHVNTLYIDGTQIMHAWSNWVVRIISGAHTENVNVVHELSNTVYENRGTLFIINIYFNDYSLRSTVIPHAQELSILPDPAGTRNYRNTVRCRYNGQFSEKASSKTPHSSKLWRDMGCLMWVETLNYILSQSVQWCMQYRLILDCVITAPDCIAENSKRECCLQEKTCNDQDAALSFDTIFYHQVCNVDAGDHGA